MRKAIVTLAVAACACAALAVECASAKPGVKATVREAGSVWSIPVIDLFADSGLYPCEPAQAMFFHDAKAANPNARISGFNATGGQVGWWMEPLAEVGVMDACTDLWGNPLDVAVWPEGTLVYRMVSRRKEDV